MFKQSNKVLQMLSDYLKIGLGFERLFFLILIDLLFIHIVACLWLITATMYARDVDAEDGSSEINSHNHTGHLMLSYQHTWLEPYMDEEYKPIELYVVAFYWSVTTIMTVGYGDISGSNNLERVFCSIMMIAGVISFSFASGSLASIIQNYDSTNAEMQERLVMLSKIYKEFKLPLELYIKIRKSMGYESKKDMNDLHDFMNELPYKLKMEVSLYVYEQRYNRIQFL